MVYFKSEEFIIKYTPISCFENYTKNLICEKEKLGVKISNPEELIFKTRFTKLSKRTDSSKFSISDDSFKN